MTNKTLSTNADKALLARFDADERYSAVFPGLRREALPHLVRHVDLLGREGVVIYSALTSDTVAVVAREQIDYFRGLGQAFEWKAFAHDPPSDLVERLAAEGFAIDEPEAVMVLDVESVPVVSDGTQDIRRVTDPALLDDVASIKQRVYVDRASNIVDQLRFELTHAPDYLSVYLAYVDDTPAATAWIRFPPTSAFASLWGGSTLPELRNRGLYTSLLASRIDEARRRSFRYVTVDAGRMSRPILEKRGFRLLTYATACTCQA